MNATAFDGPCRAKIAYVACSARAAGILLGSDHIRVGTVDDTHLISTSFEIERPGTDLAPNVETSKNSEGGFMHIATIGTGSVSPVSGACFTNLRDWATCIDFERRNGSGRSGHVHHLSRSCAFASVLRPSTAH